MFQWMCVHVWCAFSTVLDSPVTDQEFLEQLQELNNKINLTKELSFRETLACCDIQDIVDRLKTKVFQVLRLSYKLLELLCIFQN